MKLENRVTIAASPGKIREYVGSPEMWPLVHVKAGECNQPLGTTG